MKVFCNSRENNQKVNERRSRILDKLRRESMNLTQLARIFRLWTKKVLMQDLRSFQEMGIVRGVKFKGYERVYYYIGK